MGRRRGLVDETEEGNDGERQVAEAWRSGLAARLQGAPPDVRDAMGRPRDLAGGALKLAVVLAKRSGVGPLGRGRRLLPRAAMRR